jgi:hypothetical protein
MIVPAKGVQIYECRAKKAQASAHEWTFVGPRPICLIQTKSICRHYAGPHWESTDGIKIAGTVKKSETISWLLVVTKSVGSQVRSAKPPA